jgi:predicted  nucleic acid-binding Zn-ribbon protein
MNPQDLNNMASWLQEILKLLHDTHTQLIDMRNENRQVMDEIKGISSRLDHKDTDIISLMHTQRGQIDILRSDISSMKSAVEHTNSHLDSKLDDIKSAIHEVRNIVR